MKRLTCVLLASLLGGCAGIDVDTYADTTPALDLREFLNGELRAWGMLQNRSGRMTRRFTASLHGEWEGDQGVLVEYFDFDDGERQQRTWHLRHLGNGQYIGTAGDVVGEAGGKTSGSVFNWRYSLEVPWRDDSIVVNLDDWLYLVDDRHLLNRTTLSKFGFRVGELTLVIEKL